MSFKIAEGIRVQDCAGENGGHDDECAKVMFHARGYLATKVANNHARNSQGPI
jgi:hypothetical protein